MNVMKKNPLALSLIPAGFPSPADDKVDVDLNLHEFMVARPEATFFMRVSGESMKDLGIGEGDIAVVDKSIDPKSGDTVVAHVNGEFTLKVFKKQGNVGWLQPANAEYKPIKVTEDDDFQVWGVVTFIVKQLKR